MKKIWLFTILIFTILLYWCSDINSRKFCSELFKEKVSIRDLSIKNWWVNLMMLDEAVKNARKQIIWTWMCTNLEFDNEVEKVWNEFKELINNQNKSTSR